MEKSVNKEKEREYRVLFTTTRCVIASRVKTDLTDFFDNGTISYKNGFFFCELTPHIYHAYVLTYLSRSFRMLGSEETFKTMQSYASKVKNPYAFLSDNGKYIRIVVPLTSYYRSYMKKLGAWAVYNAAPGTYQCPLSKMVNLIGLNTIISHDNIFPTITFDKELENVHSENIPGFDGTLSSLKTIPLNVLHILSSDAQTYRDKKISSKTLVEKFSKLGVHNLYDLLFYLPKRYIDKSEPQNIKDLIEGETATVIGVIDNLSMMPSGKGLTVRIQDNLGGKINCIFWQQSWLARKYKHGDEVIIIGKVTRWKGGLHISGSSIDHSEEANILPVLPVYKQSPSNGLTTVVILASVYELLSRLGEIEVPSYFVSELNLSDILRGIHFPSTMEDYEESIRKFAYYELVYLQILIEKQKSSLGNRKGLVMDIPDGEDLQEKVMSNLPFTLTPSQLRAVDFLNKQLCSSQATSTLLNAEVGSGKTIVMQLACLRAVNSGFQAVLIAPTEILAQQLMKTFLPLIDSVNKDSEKKISLEFLSSSIKGKKRKEIVQKIKDGSIDIIVGTHSLFGKDIDFYNLGLVCIDEQQKFGALQRSTLLDIRKDGFSPDMIMATATPIPRTISQIMYGDIDSIMLTDRPAGRKPVDIVWVEDDPVEILSTIVDPMWQDIQEELDKGNKAFIIAPLVHENPKIDAASVDNIAEQLKTHKVLHARIGVVTGKMKKEEQLEVMQKFRSGEYNVLVASIVVEVGVDIPEATRVVILSADRLGASSIWQIKGRVGRSDLPSRCYLVSLGKTKNSQKRLESIVQAENGFDVAQVDLNIRGEGSFFGTEQSGDSMMIVASLGNHADLISKAVEEARMILSQNENNVRAAYEDAIEKFGREESLK